MTRATRLILLPLTLLCLHAPVARAADEAKRLSQLSDPDPRVREEGRIGLYALKPADLPALLDATATAARGGRLPDAAAGLLKDVVRQIFATEAVPELPADAQNAQAAQAAANRQVRIRGGIVLNGPVPSACLGVSLPKLNFANAPNGFNNGGFQMRPDDTDPPTGAVISDRLPGFGAYGPLHDGEQIIGIDGRPADLLPDSQALIDAVLLCRPGERLNLLVSRGGKVVRVPVTLSVRPAEMVLDYTSSPIVLRKRVEADAYYAKRFAPLLAPLIAPPPPTPPTPPTPQERDDLAVPRPPTLAPPPPRLRLPR